LFNRYTHLKIVFGKNPKTILPEYNSNQDLVFWKAKNQTGLAIQRQDKKGFVYKKNIQESSSVFLIVGS
jgi:hypothetical protein